MTVLTMATLAAAFIAAILLGALVFAIGVLVGVKKIPPPPKLQAPVYPDNWTGPEVPTPTKTEQNEVWAMDNDYEIEVERRRRQERDRHLDL